MSFYCNNSLQNKKIPINRDWVLEKSLYFCPTQLAVMIISRKIQKNISVILLSALVMLMYNNTVNQHKHLLPNGNYVVHAHPFSENNNNPNRNHTHTTNEFISISLFNHLFSLAIVLVLIFYSFQHRIKHRYTRCKERIIPCACIHYNTSRGPPYLM